MTIQVTLSLVVTVVGALIYFAPTGKAAELGRLAFAVGLLVALLGATHRPLF